LAVLPYAAVRNPVDATAQVFNDFGLVRTFLRTMLEEGQFDAVVAFFTMLAATTNAADELTGALEELRPRFPSTPVILSLLAPPEITERYENGGFMMFEDPTRAVAAAATLARFGRFFEAGMGSQPPPPPPGPQPVPRHRLSESGALQLLQSWGVPSATSVVVHSADEAVAAAEALGGRVVLKVDSPDLPHKTEVGGVIVGLSGESAIRAGYDTLLSRVARNRPEARIHGVLVAAEAPAGVEVVVGVQVDPSAGPVVMLGLGGILVELLDDVVFRLAPFGTHEAERMIADLRFARVLDGVRGAPRSDVQALAALLSRVSVFAAAEAERIASVDLNPVRVLPAGEGVLALDALIIPAG